MIKNKFLNIKKIKFFFLLYFVFSLLITQFSTFTFINLNFKKTLKFSLQEKYHFSDINNREFLGLNSIASITYINNKIMLARQINNNNNFQSYTDDFKGSVLKLNFSKNEPNNINYFYDAYGNRILDSVIAQSYENYSDNFIVNSFQYNSERFDDNTKLEYLRFRFYAPQRKQFVNQDNYDLLNKFDYSNSNPVINIDPSGHTQEEVLSDEDLLVHLRKIFSEIANFESKPQLEKENEKLEFLDGSFPPWEQFCQENRHSCAQFSMRNHLKAQGMGKDEFNALKIPYKESSLPTIFDIYNIYDVLTPRLKIEATRLDAVVVKSTSHEINFNTEHPDNDDFWSFAPSDDDSDIDEVKDKLPIKEFLHSIWVERKKPILSMLVYRLNHWSNVTYDGSEFTLFDSYKYDEPQLGLNPDYFNDRTIYI